MTLTIEIISIGNELLIGKTLNTNAYWLAQRATHLGATVTRMTAVGDDVDIIAQTLTQSLRRKPSFVFLTGGLGPTFDDKTLQGIAKCIRQPLEVNTTALEMIKARYKTYHKIAKEDEVSLTAARVKMATLPRGAIPLQNPVGSAPGVLVDVDDICIAVLPGVPPEMEAIFTQSILPILEKRCGAAHFFEKSVFVRGLMESNLAPLIDIVMEHNPRVYVKSHVYCGEYLKNEDRESRIELHLFLVETNPGRAKRMLAITAKELADLIKKEGGSVNTTGRKYVC